MNIKLAVVMKSLEYGDTTMTEIKDDIKDIKRASKNDMEMITNRWDDQIASQNKLTGALLEQTKALSDHSTRLGLLEKTTNFKVNKGL